MIDSKAKRAAAIGYGLSFLLVLPPADGVISIEDAGHALNAYRFNMPAPVAHRAPPERTLIAQSLDRMLEAEPLDRVLEAA